ncbi:MAG: HAD family hydrolase [Cyclobacteriaceae bacterium]|nr:HAD family hydrolase [Cyclobacteriaceae bacterium]
MPKRAAIFIDRDGTLIDDVGYIKKISEVRFYPFTIEALSLLQPHFCFFIITNQSGIGKGLTTEDEVSVVNQYIVETLKKEGINIEEVYSCPHKSEDDCACKKPKTQFIEKANEQHDIDLNKSFIIGDHPSDVQCGINAGIFPIYLLTGHGTMHQHEIDAETVVCPNILEASKYIITKHNLV